MSITAKLYQRPHGKNSMEEITDIYPIDEAYIKEKGIAVSFEDCGAIGFAMWFATGRKIEGELEEICVLANNRTCRDTIKDGVEQLKKLNL